HARTFGHGYRVLTGGGIGGNDGLYHFIGSRNYSGCRVTEFDCWCPTKTCAVNVYGITSSPHGRDNVAYSGSVGAEIGVIRPHADLAAAESEALEATGADSRALAVQQAVEYVIISAVGQRGVECGYGKALVGLTVYCNYHLVGVKLPGVDHHVV